MSPPAALVVNARYVAALGVARQLGREGIPVDGLFFGSPRRHRMARVVAASRHWRRRHWRDTADDDETIVRALLELAHRYSRPPALILVDDQCMLAVSRHRERLRDAFRFRLPAADVIEQVTLKHLFYPRALELGLPVPATRQPSTLEELGRVADGIRFPCLLKPTLRTPGWMSANPDRKLLVCETSEELRRSWRRVHDVVGEPCLVQEVVEGGEEGLLCGFVYLAADGEPLLEYQSRKLRQSPPGYGDTSLAETTRRADVIEQTLLAARRLGLTGYLGSEFKVDSRTGRLVLLEITVGRLDGQAPMAILSGINIPRAFYRDALGEPEPEPSMDPRRLRWVSEPEELRSIPAYLSRGLIKPLELVRSFRGVRGSAVLSARDPGPALRLVLLLPGVALAVLKNR